MTVIILWLDTDYVALKTFLNVSKALFIFLFCKVKMTEPTS